MITYKIMKGSINTYIYLPYDTQVQQLIIILVYYTQKTWVSTFCSSAD